MQFVRNLLGAQRKRLVATIMSAVDQHMTGLSEGAQRDLRNRIIAAINQHHEVCSDIVRSSVNDGSEVNEEALRILGRVNQLVAQVQREDV